MVEMAVRERHRVELRRIDLQELHVVEERRRLETEIEQHVACLAPGLGLEPERQAPFAVQRAAEVLERSADAADAYRFGRRRAQEDVMVLLHEHPDRETVDRRDLPRRRGLGRDLAEQRELREKQRRAEHEFAAT